MSQKVRIFAKKDTLSFLIKEDEQSSHFIIFDYEGRLHFLLKDGITFRRGFDNSVIAGDVYSQEAQFIDNNQSKKIISDSYNTAKEIILSKDFDLIFLEGNNENVKYAFEKIQNTSYQYVIEDAKKFREIFKPITILPPDQYMSLYIPITEGCSYNKCSFCNLYKDRSFRIKTPQEVSILVKRISQFFGRTLLTRRSIFLGEGNALVENTNQIINAINSIKTILQKNPYITFDINDNFYGFMDTFHTRKSKKELEDLKNAGVKRVYIGLESGDDFILTNILKKPSSSENVLETVLLLKEVGINVGIIIIVGVGGKELKEQHFTKTVSLIEDMNLSSGDIVYLSPIVEYSHLEYKIIMDKMGLTRLSVYELTNEVKRFKAKISEITKGVKIPIYRVDKFLYA